MKKQELQTLILEVISETLLITENLKLAKQNFLEKGLISQKQFDAIVALDPSPSKKYTYWLVRTVLNEKIKELSELQNAISEFDVFATRDRVEKKDIMTYKSFADLKKVVDKLNSMATASSREAESDFEVVVDTPTLWVASPHTWEASSKLGLTRFAQRYNTATGNKDSVWCTTFKNNSHFNDYYLKQGITFYYIDTLGKLRKSVETTFGHQYIQIAITVDRDGTVKGWDVKDSKLNNTTLQKFLKFINLK